MRTQPAFQQYQAFHMHEPQQEVALFEIAAKMKVEKLSNEFIAAAIRTALNYEGVADLVLLWANENDPVERNEIIADIQEMIEACSQPAKVEYPYIKLNDLDTIAKDIRKFKDRLLEQVIKQGGIKHLSELTGIPQPSLSRFFNSNAMPQRSTLLKIGKALKLDAVQLSTEWVR